MLTQTLTAAVEKHVFSVPPTIAIEAGTDVKAARGIALSRRQDKPNSMLRAYSDSLRSVFCFLTCLAALTTAMSLGRAGRM